MTIDLFSVQFQPGIGGAPVNLICQSIDIDGEKLLWCDGLDPDFPVIAPISALKEIKWVGSFGDFMRKNLEHAEAIINYTQGDYSPTIMARAMACMDSNPNLTAEDAITLVEGQSLDILDQDLTAAHTFHQVYSNFS